MRLQAFQPDGCARDALHIFVKTRKAFGIGFSGQRNVQRIRKIMALPIGFESPSHGIDGRNPGMGVAQQPFEPRCNFVPLKPIA